VLLLGIDAGGTKTVCHLADETGRLLAESRGPGATLRVMPDAAVGRTLGQVIAEAVGARHDEPMAICIGMSGVDRPGEADRVRGILHGLGRNARVLVVSDALIALEAGAPGAPGVVIIAGTGSMAFGRDRDGRAARAGGWGYLLADEGSGYWLGRQALRAVVRAYDGRGPATALTGLVLEHWNVSRPPDLVHTIYTSDPKPTTIASLASTIQTAADAGDGVARGLLHAAAQELATSGVSVARRLKLLDGPVILSGNLFRVVPSLRAGVVERLGRDLPGALVRPLEAEPVSGAVRLAAELARDTLKLPRYENASA
jgi:N-acetylglucosamine kinase-like BadF-type ATPase